DAVAVISGISAAPDLHNVHILGIKLRADISGNIGVGNGNPVHQPRNLMAATYMELVVNHVGTGSVVGDEVEAIRAGGSGCFGNSLATQSNRGRRGCGVKRLRGLTDFDAFGNAGNLKRKVAQWSGVGDHDEVTDIVTKAVARDTHGVIAGGNGIHLK